MRTRHSALMSMMFLSAALNGWAQPPAPVAGGSGAARAAAEPPDAYFHGWRGVTTPVYLSKDRIGFTFAPGLSATEIRAILASETALDQSTFEVSMKTAVLESPRALMINTVPGTLREDVLRIVETLGAAQGIYAVHPVYRASPNDERESALLNMVYVTLPSAVPDKEALKLFADDGLEVFTRNDYSEIGIIGYRLRIPKGSRAAAGGTDAIDVANRYAGHPLVLESVPTFAPLYSTQASTPNDPLYPVGNLIISTGQWNLTLMNGPDAWTQVYGTTPTGASIEALPRIVVACLDNGVELDYGRTTIPKPGGGSYNIEDPVAGTHYVLKPGDPYETISGHQDLLQATTPLQSNQWLNWAEISGNGLYDDDGNGRVDDYYGWDFVGADPFDTSAPIGDRIPYSDYNANSVVAGPRNHGGLSAGQIAARGNNALGMAGVCWGALIMPVRYHYNTGGLGGRSDFELLYTSHSESGIIYAYQAGAKVISFMSVYQMYDLGVHTALRNARKYGCVVLAPMGNNAASGDSLPNFPGVLPEVIGVGASYQWDNYGGWNVTFTQPGDNELKSRYSVYGWSVDVVAPSTGYDDFPPVPGWTETKPIIGTTNIGSSGYSWGGGTSSAMPQAAGVAALMLTANPDLSPAEIQANMQWSAKDMDYRIDANKDGDYVDSGDEVAGAGRDYYTGWGRLDMNQAVTLAKKKRFSLRNSSGKSLVSWDEDGRFVVDGDFRENAAISHSDTDAIPDFVIKSSSGINLARLDATWTVNPDGTLTRPTFYLKGQLQSTWVEPNSAASEFIIQNSAQQAVAYIDANGNMWLKPAATSTPNGKYAYSFVAGNPDPVGTYTVGPTGSGYNYTGPTGIQQAINAVPERSIIVVAQGTYDPITFGGKNVVVRSTNPNSAAVVAATIIRRASGTGPVVDFSGSQNENSSLQGFTIYGGNCGSSGFGGGVRGASTGGSAWFGTRASIINNVFRSNSAGAGGALAYCHGLIQGNTIGVSGLPNTATSGTLGGGGLYMCNGLIRRNKITWNTAANGGGGAFNDCEGGIEQNYVAHNSAASGGGFVECDGRIYNNIICLNSATNFGGGLYECDSVEKIWYGFDHCLDNNTIYGNTAASGGGLYGCDAASFRNNIIWGNTPSNPQIVQGTPLPSYSCIQNWSGGGSNNITSNPLFISTAESAPWQNFLHLSAGSPCIDTGQTDVDQNQQLIPQLDFDQQAAPIDGNSDTFVFRDIGADEIPTPAPSVDFFYWWEWFGASPG